MNTCLQEIWQQFISLTYISSDFISFKFYLKHIKLYIKIINLFLEEEDCKIYNNECNEFRIAERQELCQIRFG